MEKKGSRPLPWLGDHVREVCRYAYLSTITPAKPSGNNSIAPSYPEHLSTTGFGCDGALINAGWMSGADVWRGIV